MKGGGGRGQVEGHDELEKENAVEKGEEEE